MSVTTETAKVYRGGGRRWFTLKSAIHAEAKASYKMLAAERCYCDHSPHHDPMKGGNDTCRYHETDAPVYQRFVRRASYLITQSLKAKP